MLHSIKYGEQKLIVDMFTRVHGRLSFIVQIPKTSKGKLKKQYFQPLTLLSVESDVRPQLQLQRMRDVALLSPLPTLLTDPVKLSISLFLSEFLYHALKGEQQNEALFDYVSSSLQWLDGRERDYTNFHLVFLMHLSRFLGFYPNLEREELAEGSQKLREGGKKPAGTQGEWVGERDKGREQTVYFDLRSATFCSLPPVHRDFLMPQEAGVLQLMMRMDYPTMHLFHLSRQQRNRCVEVALLFYRLHLPDFPDLHSLDILHELWD